MINTDLYNDGGYAPYTDTQLILQNNCSERMIITDIQAVKSCESPLDGPIFVGQPSLSEPSSAAKGTAAESDVDLTQIGFDLDSSNPEAMLANSWNTDQWVQEYATGSLASIPGNGAYTFDIRTIALHKACSFRIQITYVYDNKTHTETLGDDGQPFRVSALLPGALEFKNAKNHPYADYAMLYVGWNASPWPDGSWVRENPKTWQLPG